MNPSNLHNDIPVKNFVLPSHQALLSRFGTRDGRKVLMALLLGQLHEVFNVVFHDNIESNQNNSSMECYTMDSKIIQLLISGIVDSGNYTLEGIAYHTRIPFDVIMDAACGNTTQISITPWARIVGLYIQVNPEISRVLFERLLELGDKNPGGISLLVNEACQNQ
jgi:hypothetical protein